MINDNFLCKNIEKTNNKQLYLFHYFTIILQLHCFQQNSLR